MNNKKFTDELFQIMHDLGYRKVEIADGTLYFFVDKNEYLNLRLPRLPVKCTCFEERDQLIDIAEYLGIVDWSKVAVDTPVLVKSCKESKWKKRYFAFYKDGKAHTWDSGATSWSKERIENTSWWNYIKLAEV